MKRALSFVLLMALLVPMVATETFAIGPSTAPNNASMTIAEFTNAYVGDTAAPASTSSINENDSNSGDAPDIAYSGISYKHFDQSNFLRCRNYCKWRSNCNECRGYPI